MPQINYKKFGFTLIELLVVIAIIGILSTLAVIALGNARAKARDSKRVADIQQITKALELYYQDNSSYPTLITPGNSLVSPDGNTTYMAKIPSNPSPKNDNGCGNNDYTYSSTPDNTNYSLNFCLGNPVASTPAGINSASNAGVGTAPGLIGWWKFDEGNNSTTIADSSGNNNTGTWSGTGTHYTTGKTGLYAGQFNGGNDYVLVSDSSSLINSKITISAWIYRIGDGGQPGRAIAVSKGVDYIDFAVPAFCSSFLIGETQRYNCSATISNGQWFHVVATYDGATVKHYVNGSLTGSVDFNLPLDMNLGDLYLGRYAGGSYQLNGYLDDVRIYNRALSQTEINALYQAGAN